jgi:outer membrane lipoprotein-sorting protein
MMKRTLFGWMIRTLVLCALLVFSSVALSAEFSADLIQKTAGMTTKGKVYIKGNKMRMEMETPAGKSINLMDIGTGLMQMLQPEQKMYFEMQTPEAGVVKTDDALDKIADKKHVGTEKVNGYKCDKYEIIYHDRSLGKMSQWFSKKLNYPIKIIYNGPQGEMVVEYKNIKQGKVDSSLFEIPPGYEKMKIPGMGRPSYQ